MIAHLSTFRGIILVRMNKGCLNIKVYLYLMLKKYLISLYWSTYENYGFHIKSNVIAKKTEMVGKFAIKTDY